MKLLVVIQLMRSPDRYKKKNCEKCGKIHRKRGKFCSKACANSIPASAAKKRKLSEKATEFHRSEDGEAASRRQSEWASALNRYKHGYTIDKPEALSVEDFKLEIPDIKNPLRDNQFLEGGDIWETV